LPQTATKRVWMTREITPREEGTDEREITPRRISSADWYR